jgi:hypothetical protein
VSGPAPRDGEISVTFAATAQFTSEAQ